MWMDLGTARGFASARAELGLSYAELLRALPVGDFRTIKRWENGDQFIPGWVRVALEHRRLHGVWPAPEVLREARWAHLPGKPQ